MAEKKVFEKKVFHILSCSYCPRSVELLLNSTDPRPWHACRALGGKGAIFDIDVLRDSAKFSPEVAV